MPSREFCWPCPAVLFDAGVLAAKTQTISWMIVFFFASAAASAAYLTVSEIFPVEIRALAIAVFYAIGTGIGGVAAPVLFGALIETEKRGIVLIGYLVGAALMIGAGIVQALFGVAAEGKSLNGRSAVVVGRLIFSLWPLHPRSFDKPYDHTAETAHVLFGEMHPMEHIAQIVLHHRPFRQGPEEADTLQFAFEIFEERDDHFARRPAASAPLAETAARCHARPSSIRSRSAEPPARD